MAQGLDKDVIEENFYICNKLKETESWVIYQDTFLSLWLKLFLSEMFSPFTTILEFVQ